MIQFAKRGSPFLAGAVAALGLAPWSFWQFTLIGLAYAFYLEKRAQSPLVAAQHGWGFGLGYFGVGIFWIVEPFLVDPLRHGWMAPFALFFMAGGLALFWGVAFWLSKRFMGGFVLVPLWTLSEVLRGFLFTGFPWAGFSQVWVGQGSDQLLAFVGPHGLDFLTLVAAWALFRASFKRHLLSGVVAAALPVCGVVMSMSLPEETQTGPMVRLVQPNAPQHEKWNPEKIPMFWERQISLTSAASEKPLDLIVWPETSVPTILRNAAPAFERIASAAEDAVTVVGIQRFDGKRLKNALVTVGNDGSAQEIYDKHHLVPFGEYVPFGDLMAGFGIYGFAAQEGQGFSPGPGPRIIDFGKAGRGLPLICYEAVFPRLARMQGHRPDFLIQITNDAWFGRISGPYQHFAQSRMRAIEQGLPMIRSANTGISAVIDPLGRVVGALPLGISGFVDVELPVALSPTIYSKTGDWAAVFGALFLMFVVFVTHRRRRHTKSIDPSSTEA